MRLIALAAFAALLTTAAHADTTTTSFNLAPGACGSPIAVPANNKPVIIAGPNIQNGNRGTGMVSLIRANGFNNPLLLWAGTDLAFGAERSLAGGPGTVIMYLDGAAEWVTLQSATSTHIQVCNSSNNGSNAVGYLTFTY